MATVSQRLPRSVKAKADPERISEYSPLASVWFGEDPELLGQMLAFYPRRKPRKILDATVNGGRFWKDSKHPVVGLDIDPRHRPMIVADNTQMPFRDGCFDVVVYDPPHIPNQGKDNKKDFSTRFGLVLRSSKENHYTFSHTFPPFVKEAYRVLKTEGILLCKITDYVHHHRKKAHGCVALIEDGSRISKRSGPRRSRLRCFRKERGRMGHRTFISLAKNVGGFPGE